MPPSFRQPVPRRNLQSIPVAPSRKPRVRSKSIPTFSSTNTANSSSSRICLGSLNRAHFDLPISHMPIPQLRLKGPKVVFGLLQQRAKGMDMAWRQQWVLLGPKFPPAPGARRRLSRNFPISRSRPAWPPAVDEKLEHTIGSVPSELNPQG